MSVLKQLCLSKIANIRIIGIQVKSRNSICTNKIHDKLNWTNFAQKKKLFIICCHWHCAKPTAKFPQNFVCGFVFLIFVSVFLFIQHATDKTMSLEWNKRKRVNTRLPASWLPDSPSPRLVLSVCPSICLPYCLAFHFGQLERPENIQKMAERPCVSACNHLNCQHHS